MRDKAAGDVEERALCRTIASLAAELAELTAKMRATDGDGAKLAMLPHEYAKEMASLSRAHEAALRAAEAKTAQ